MSDQQPPAQQDTAAVAGPDQAPGTAEGQQGTVDPYEKRYNDLRPQFDRTTAERAELAERQQWYDIALTTEDEDTRRQALEALGYQIPEEEDPEPAEYQDPYEELSARQQAIEEQLNQSRQEQQMAQEAALIREFTDEKLSALEGLPQEDQDWVLAYAINSLPAKHEPGVPVPLPDVEQAHAVWQAREVERQKSWAKTKKAPYVSPGGQPANEVPDPGTGHESRMNRAMRAIHEAQE